VLLDLNILLSFQRTTSKFKAKKIPISAIFFTKT